ncbi:MAG TPA: CRISPR-associated endonuclease Cas2 [Patescibacteria group bacterium]|nr:CRISPR-associated endonuclease Cas2 [Patescibacteria group bacterium]
MYKRDHKKLTKTSRIILSLLAAKKAVEPFVTYRSLESVIYSELTEYYANRRFNAQINRLIKQGWIKEEYRDAKKLITLTKKGKIQALFAKTTSEATVRIAQKWQLVIFDVPEGAREVRAQLRSLLKKLGFKALQASVYISPYMISPASVEYLKASKLINYIRFLRVDKIDNDSDIKKIFNL